MSDDTTMIYHHTDSDGKHFANEWHGVIVRYSDTHNGYVVHYFKESEEGREYHIGSYLNDNAANPAPCFKALEEFSSRVAKLMRNAS